MYVRGELERALDYFELALKFSSDHEDARKGRELCLKFLNDWKQTKAQLDPPYDIFLSYKSDDVHVVRRIADELIARNRKVWFAEYQILFGNYADFENAIEKGIRYSKYGLAFTNERYAGSVHCQHEMTMMLKHCGPEKVLKINMENGILDCGNSVGHPDSPQITFDGRIQPVLSFIQDKTEWPLDGNTAIDKQPSPQRQKVGQCMDRSFYLDTAGWRDFKRVFLSDLRNRLGQDQIIKDFLKNEEDKGTMGLIAAGGRFDTPTFTSELAYSEHQTELFVDIKPYSKSISIPKELIGKEQLVSFLEGALSIIEYEKYRRLLSDRELYKAMLPAAERMLQELMGASPRGLHLFFHKGRAHMGLTYCWKFGGWGRRYDIVFPYQEGNVTFTFSFLYSGPFRLFCRHVHKMERLVKSLRW